MMKSRILRLATVALLSALLASPAYAQSLTGGGGGGGSPTGTASGDLSGTYPGPTVAAVNGNSVPAGAAADQLLVGTAANTLSLKTLTNCASPNGVTYNTTTHAFGCGTAPGASFGSIAIGSFDELPGGVFVGTSTSIPVSSARCAPHRASRTETISSLSIRITTATAAAGHAYLALYAQVPQGSGTGHIGWAGALLGNTTIAADVTGNITGAMGASVQITAGTVYFECTQWSDALGIANATGAGPFVDAMMGVVSLTTNQNLAGLTYSGLTSGVWPSDLTTGTTVVEATSVNIPDLYLTVASVP